MEKKTFLVPNIGCDGCVRTVTDEINSIEGARLISGDVDTKTVTVEWNAPATWEKIEHALAEIEYAPAQG